MADPPQESQAASRGEDEELSPAKALAEWRRLNPAAPPETLGEQDKLIGRKLGQYKLLGKIGQGGMGMVFRAHDDHLDRDVALKLLYCGPLDDEKVAERFRREASNLAKLSHPNLLHVHNVGQNGPLHFFAMELLAGETLAARLKRRARLTPEELLPWIGQVLSALDYVHRQGITHRDVKGANIMLCGERAVLMDFGLAKDERQPGLTTADSVMGTPEYMAPEQAEGHQYGPYTDLYSLGVVMYEALCGELPFKGRSAFAIIRQHLEEPPPFLAEKASGLDQKLCQAIHRCLAKKPADRYPDAASLAADLVHVVRTKELQRLVASPSAPTVARKVGGEAVPAPTEELPGNSGTRPETAMPGWAWMAGAFAAVLLLGLLVWAVLPRGTNPAEPLKKREVEKKEPEPAPEPLRALPIESLEGQARMVEFRGGGDPAQWTWIMEVRQADGSWKQETIVGQKAFEARFAREPR